MCVLLWTALLFYVRGISCDGAALKQHCQTGSYCISLSEGGTTAEAGLCAVIPCSFTVDAGFNATQLMWYKCGAELPMKCNEAHSLTCNSSSRSAVFQSEFRGRVSLLEPDLSLRNCSIIISDLRQSDSGSFKLRLCGYKDKKPDGFTFTSSATLTVTGLSQTPTVTVPPLTAGQQNTVTCTAPGLCSGSAPTFTWRWRKPGGTHSHITGNITAVTTENVSAVTQRHSSTLTFDLSTKHHGTEVTCEVSFTGDVKTEETVTLNVSYVKKPTISGNPTVKAGDALNLTCRVDSFPPSYVTWTKSGSDGVGEESQTGSVSVIIYNTTADASGQYVCTAQHPVRNVTARSEVTVTFPPQILNVSRCMNQQQTLSCVCISWGSPPPSITWPLLKNHSEYSVSSTVSKHTANSSVTLHGSAQSSSVECVSTNEGGETREFLQVRTHLKQEDVVTNVLLNSKWLQVAFGFITGILFSAVVVCLARRCHRKKNPGDQLEAVQMQTVLEADAGHNHETQCREVNYSVIDFFVLKRKKPTKTKEAPESTEYTEIKTRAVERRHGEGKEGETLEAHEEQEVAEVEQRENQQCIVGKEEEYEEMALYSNVHETKQQIQIDEEETETEVKTRRRRLETEGFSVEGASECQRIRMCVLLWTALLFYVRGISCDGAALKQHCQTGSYCISLSERRTTAEAGLCAVIPCSFTADAGFNVTQLMWYKCGSQSLIKCDQIHGLVFNSSNKSAVFQSGFGGRVSLLEPDLSLRNCSIIISDLRQSDSGSFQLRLCGYKDKKPDGFTFTSPVNLTVTGLSQSPTVTVPPLTAGQQNTVTCTAPGLCSGSAPTFTWRWRKPGGTHSHITGNITAVTTENVSAVTQRHSSTLTFDLSAEHHGTEVTCEVSFTGDVKTEETVTLNVSYVKKPTISGNPTVKAGDALNLTCRVDSFPPSYVTWTKSGSDGVGEESQTGSVSVIIYNTTADASGQYVCTAQHPVRNVTARSEVTVTFPPQILNVSRCMNQQQTLSCVCISWGSPPPSITWPLLKNHSEYSVSSTVSKHTANSSVTLHGSAQSSSVECVSTNEEGETRQFLQVRTHLKQEDVVTNVLLNSKWLQVAFGFFTGILFSAVVVCLARRCHRKKNPGDQLEAVQMQNVLEADAGHNHETQCREVNYSVIDFFVLKRKKPTKTKEAPESTEYTEIKTRAVERRHGEGKEGETLEAHEEQEVAEVEQRENQQCIVGKEEEYEEMALYSNVHETKQQV
ncbi:uncharacterized protein LOC114842457 [Betta splendens]|uniref:B-cell receptor CD22 n=1 Tax=Betta splendens TaxID=158456 RepID=A0A9W2XBY0_BETSP|nr:uncharacterized protein LOC114842457 [Betta splendens]